ncbi:hypothetical protein H5410_038677 [Solanum commersonii]|uniref:Uncharacterized protein n=1 Tax=Solanum commersonii TaxID=4109 RepID=A0A9J5YBD6_SOLCO|nr:hypothetical protein H5410_038677 [Solanum commersonii]
MAPLLMHGFSQLLEECDDQHIMWVGFASCLSNILDAVEGGKSKKKSSKKLLGDLNGCHLHSEVSPNSVPSISLIITFYYCPTFTTFCNWWEAFMSEKDNLVVQFWYPFKPMQDLLCDGSWAVMIMVRIEFVVTRQSYLVPIVDGGGRYPVELVENVVRLDPNHQLVQPKIFPFALPW